MNGADRGALPPHSVEAEAAMLGGALLAPEASAQVREIVDAGHLYVEAHRAIFRAIQRVEHEGERADVLTVARCLQVDGELEAVGGVEYLRRLVDDTPGIANVRAYARHVREHADRRELAAFAAEAHAAAMAPGADIAAVRADLEDKLAGTSRASVLVPLDLVALADREPTPPRMLMTGLPAGYATLLAGHGGAGKSQIAAALGACIASEVPFFGLEVQRRRVLFLSCEDREDVLHWRLSRLCAHFGIGMGELAGWLSFVDLVGRDSILWRADPRAGNGVTPVYRRVATLMRDTRAEVLIVDGISDTFGGNENDRAHVKGYVNALLGLVPADRGALVLIGHVSKSSAGGFGSEGYSGSTAWHNAARARWYLRPETRPGEDGERTEKTGALVLELQKANHGGALSLRFEWDEAAHLFAGELVGAPSHFDQVHQDREEARGILAALKASADAGVPVPAATMGQRTGFNVLAARPEFPPSLLAGKAGKRRFWRHIEQLRQQRAIEEGSYRRTNRHTVPALVLTAEGMRQCVE